MSGGEVTPSPGIGGSNASEFVRKLYRMLEDPAHQEVARWGKDGDTFVVVENEKFTRSILPKHFKHSNMASFVRQLNKYDFHKVRQTNDTGSSAGGANTLEFKHPNFKVGSKDDLDNIRRKAPAPRRTQATEDFTTSHHISVLTEQLTATQQQVQQLQELFTEVSQTNRLLVNEVLTLQKMLNAQKQSQHEMLNFMSSSDRNNRHQQSMHLSVGTSPLDGDESAPELRRARELLSSVTPDSIADRELERLQGVYGSPADSAVVIPQASMPMMHDPMNDINRYPVYPVGQTVGIDPFHSDHIHKIPYAMPNDSSAGPMQELPTPQPINTAAAAPTSSSSSSNTSALLWGARKPRIFLVEDDPTCSKIGIKFLKSMGCEVEHAQNGAEAYSRITSVGRDHFDMIFMDIIMPRLDGVSTTMYIRQDCPSIPIVAMTSNIRSDEVHCYFEHGMNGVLAKPFTKSGMLKIVENHLSYLLKNYDPATQQESGSGYVVGGAGYMNPPGSLNTSGTTTFKFETTPTPPATGSTWSPGQMPQASPMATGMDQGYGMVNGTGQYGMTPTSATRATFPGGVSQPHANSQGRLDNQSPPEKRQRTYA
ncbi:HSF-type DNA-binding-domain-containing protein [Ilyonectria robusta]|uniref:HSF-type DNA-binding-domain-containing protein n=1 Tax=Ilyonectria robusta TaxID=1079257 RepID=UPI001E8E5DDC|nr:HSF-type DNA-binding-domain-containing protein [Ilyonectria robusta]KAH8706765.1 HSF-type DNA-binding-domain-containing protein [Ilyonectria robusta]